MDSLDKEDLRKRLIGPTQKFDVHPFLYSMKTDKREALAAAGILQSHGNVFLRVAESTKCIIMCRCPGKYVPDLLAENYASKGFHNKAKSCHWGPMAGFVLERAIFSKQGFTTKGFAKQKEMVQKAKADGTTTTPLFISPERVDWLKAQFLIGVSKTYVPKRPEGYERYTEYLWVTPRLQKYQGDASQLKIAKKYRFQLRKRILHENTVYAVFWTKLKGRRNEFEANTRWEPVNALVDSTFGPDSGISFDFTDLETAAAQVQTVYSDATTLSAGPRSGTTVEAPNIKQDFDISGKEIYEYKKATTGDYDLFAVWGRTDDVWTDKTGKPNKTPLDAHKAPTSKISVSDRVNPHDKEKVKLYRIKSFEDLEELENKDLGNMTPRLGVVRYKLNEGFRGSAGYYGGDLVNHAAESGRPFIDDVDFPFMVFTPSDRYAKFNGVRCFLIEEASEFRTFIETVEDHYTVILNPAWAKELYPHDATFAKYQPKTEAEINKTVSDPKDDENPNEEEQA